ncbi:MAG: two-component system response regulator [Labilithrix sp.]|nr:two-component system response regulator [Labilithrix sp.]
MRTDRVILLVEDDAVDQMTVRRALRELRISNPLVIAESGEEALAMLESFEELPCMTLLDINMPRMNGLELLAAMKADERLRRIPVVMLTTSTDDRDRFDSFDRSVAGYMVKPVDYPQFVELMRTLDLYWTISEAA